MADAAAAPDDADRILLVDDDASNLDVLRHTLDGLGYRLYVSKSGEAALDVARRVRPLLVLLDVVMPGIDGYETCRRLKADPATAEAAVIFLSSLDETRDKVRGLEVGAVDFVSKPFEKDEVIARVKTHLTLQRLQRQLEARNQELARELEVARELQTDARRRVDGALLGESPPIRALRESIDRYAKSGELVLLTGAPGAGHEAAARAIHHASPRGDQAFIHVNCGLLAPQEDAGLLQAGAAASGARFSLLDVAARGTLYLEEVQRLPFQTQARLADVLEASETQREAGRKTGHDVRFIAFSSAPLVAGGACHDRLRAVLERRQLRIPGLTERAEDVTELAQFFVSQHARRIGALVETIGHESLKRLKRYHWPGDVAELQGLLERAVASARGPVLEIDPSLLSDGTPLGSYRLIEKLGEGGMGEVWRARHQLLARPCAVKLIRQERLANAHSEKIISRFRQEARAISQMTSPNTVRLYDFGVSESGSLYFVMELLVGLDLATLVQRFGPLPPERVVSVLRQACRSLAEAHAAGMLHRDIKPHNLLLCRLGLDFDVVKVLDFGLVKSLREGAENLTADGALTGTPAYMPPERVFGDPADERSDIYSLGCVAYLLLTGRPLFTGDTMALLVHHGKTAPEPPSKTPGVKIPAELERLVLACLEKAPEKRPGSALELWKRLGELPLAEPWTPERAEDWWRRELPDLAASRTDGDSSGEFSRPTPAS